VAKREPIPLPGVQEQDSPSGSVGPNNLLSWTIKKGRRIRAIWLEFLTAAGAAVARSAIESQISSVELKASTSSLWDVISPARLHALMNYYGAAGVDGAADDGVIRLDSALIPGAVDPNFPQGGRAVIDGEALALGTEGLGAIQLSVRCGTISTVAQVRAYVDYGDEDEAPGYVRRIKVSNESGWGTSKKALNLTMRAVTPPGADESIPDRLLALHVTGYGSGVISDVEIMQGSTVIQRLYATTWGRAIRRNHRTAQSSYYHFELSRDRTILGALALDPDNPVSVHLTWSTQPDSGQFVAILDGAAYWHGGNAG
jgi:hypothetical protein